MKIRVGTRESQLALAQTNIVINEIKKHYPEAEFEIIRIKTTGDMLYNKNLALIGGKGLFLKEIEESLIASKIDLAVHSMKDVPAVLPESLIIDSVLEREDVRDAFISDKYNSLEQLPFGAVVGTSSSRRKAAILSKRPDLIVKNFRGNVITRLDKLAKGEVDATILAYAGLKRLGLEKVAKYIFDCKEMLPAIAQGAIGIERRVADEKMAEVIAKVNHTETMTCITAERSFLYHLSGDCTTPISAYATLAGEQLSLVAQLAESDGTILYSSSQTGSKKQALEIGKAAADEIKNKSGILN
ncbi:hydroxymethylbilane synthase [Candidatus Jidaibacter acanthamoebae]|nr:hydroxymethylbilane synthase [Candidatus Jidaibacter acanthamoeba]